MRNWWYESEGESVGPVSEADLIAFIKANPQKNPQLVWSSDMADWSDARKIPEFADVFGPTPPPLPKAPPKPTLTPPISRLRIEPIEPIETPKDVEEVREFSDGVHPWRRYFARMIDWTVISIITFLLLLWFVTSFRMSLSSPILVFYIAFLIVGIFAEAALLATIGTTLGKALLGIRIRPKMSFSTALYRSWLVLTQGLWLNIPVLAFIGCYFGYKRLTLTGKTAWDQELGLDITHSVLRWWRWVGIVLIWFVLTAFWRGLTR